jgi:uncharacterized protein (TIGR02217 family)
MLREVVANCRSLKSMSATQRTGIATSAAGHVATAGAAVTASFNFDVTVRFDTDHLSALAAGVIPKIPAGGNRGVIWRFGCRE